MSMRMHAEDEHGEHEHNHIEGFNEHVWYDPHTIEHFVETLAEGLEERIPDAADEIAANAESVLADIAALEGQLSELETAHGGGTVFFTEPIGGYLAIGAGLDHDASPRRSRRGSMSLPRPSSTRSMPSRVATSTCS